jgi:endonuclease YncB( thermonuclease family)
VGRAHCLGEPVKLARRLLSTALALAGVLIGSYGIGVAGKRLTDDYAATAATKDVALDAETEELALQAAEPDRTVEPPREQRGSDDTGATDSAEPAGANYERIEPRAPLGELGTAQPPKPKKPAAPDDWRPTRLFNPVATSAGIIEAQGYRVALAGIEPTAVDQDCTFDGRQWPCGARARTAFRAWLRARAVQCVVPPTPDRELITAECHIGKADVSAWLVESGWAKPADGEQFAEAAEKARAAKRGIYGPPQNRVNLTIDPGRPVPLNAPVVEAAVPEGPAGAAPPPEAGPFPPPPPAASAQ